MSKKGGEENLGSSALSLRSFAVCFIAVMAGVAFVLIMIYCGLLLGDKYDKIIDSNRIVKSDLIESEELVAVKYDAEQFSYIIDSDEAVNDGESSLIRKFNDENSGYTVIKSKTRYDALLDLVGRYSVDLDLVDEYLVDEDFFVSGSVVAIAVEGTDMASYQVRNVERDAGYSLKVTLEKTDNESNAPLEDDTANHYGQLFLIKVDNIQPRLVEVDEYKEVETDDLGDEIEK